MRTLLDSDPCPVLDKHEVSAIPVLWLDMSCVSGAAQSGKEFVVGSLAASVQVGL